MTYNWRLIIREYPVRYNKNPPDLIPGTIAVSHIIPHFTIRFSLCLSQH